MTEKVIVAVDGGAASTSAVEWVIERARTVPLQLEVTTVIEPGWEPPDDQEHQYQSAFDAALQDASDRVVAAVPSVHTTQLVRRGKPADTLISASRYADLLVIGTNKTGRFAGIVHGTLPLRVAGRAQCPTVVVPVGWEPGASGIVVGWDNDGTGDVALDFAATEARRLGVTLTVVHAWHVPPAIGVDAMGSAMIYQDIVDAQRAEFTAALARVRTQHPTLDAVEKFGPGPVSVALVESAKGAQLLVVGTHGRRAIGGLILGSVSHDALMNMPAPVVVVPYPEEPITVLPEIVDEDLI